MDRQELKELIRETVKEVKDEESPVYKDLKDVPDYWKCQAAGLLNAGVVNGGTPAEVCDTDLKISMETLNHDYGRYVPQRRARRDIRHRSGGNNPPGCFYLETKSKGD